MDIRAVDRHRLDMMVYNEVVRHLSSLQSLRTYFQQVSYPLLLPFSRDTCGGSVEI